MDVRVFHIIIKHMEEYWKNIEGEHMVKMCTYGPVWNSVFNSLPNDKILDRLKFKAIADNKTNVSKKLKFVLGRVEDIVGKGENAGQQHFLLFSQCFEKASLQGC